MLLNMGIFSKKEKRSNPNEDVKNPCPIDDNVNSMSLSNLLKQFKDNNPMTLSPFFAGVNMIANSVSLMNWIFKNDEDEELKKTHYLWHLFDDSKLTRFQTIKNVIQDILLHGNGFIFIKRNPESGQPISLHYSPASQTTMYLNPLNNELYYLNPIYSSKWDNGDNYLHFYINSDNGYIGKSIVSYAYKVIKLANCTEKSAHDYYSSGGQLYGLITTNSTQPNVGTREKQINSLRQSWDEARSQSQGTGVIFIPADLNYHQLSSNAKDSALLESRLYNVTEVARFLNISPMLLGDLSHVAYNSLADAQREFQIHTLQPYVIMIEEEAQRKLIMPSKRGKEFIDLNESAILAIDAEKQANYYTTLVKNGLFTINEARHQLGMPPVDGADNLIIPFTNLEQNTIGTTEEDKNINDTEDEQGNS